MKLVDSEIRQKYSAIKSKKNINNVVIREHSLILNSIQNLKNIIENLGSLRETLGESTDF